MNPEQIFNSCVSLLNDISREENKHLSEAELITKFTPLYDPLVQRSKKLFEKIINERERFEIGRLQNMLNLKTKIDNGETTQHNASVAIGQKYYDDYIKPKIN